VCALVQCVIFLSFILYYYYYLDSVYDLLWSNAIRDHKRFGNMYKLNFLHRTFLFCNNVEFGRFMVSKRGGSKYFSKKIRFIDNLTMLFGTNVFTAHDESVWRRHRLILNPAFTDHSLECVVSATAQVMNNYLNGYVKSSGSTRDILLDTANIALNVIGKAGFGYEFDAFNETSVCL